MNIKNSIVCTALTVGLSVGQLSAFDNDTACVGNDYFDLTAGEIIIPNILTSSLVLETKKSVSEAIYKPKECETDEMINLFTAFENACKDVKK